jgi:hypothetical protein
VILSILFTLLIMPLPLSPLSYDEILLAQEAVEDQRLQAQSTLCRRGLPSWALAWEPASEPSRQRSQVPDLDTK